MDGKPLHILVFEIAGQQYGLPAVDVQELVRAVAVISLPRAPVIVEGIMNLRGRTVPVLDLRARFRLPARPPAPSDHFVVARAGERLVALRVDRALELVHVAPADLEDAGAVVPGAEYVTWIARRGGDLVIIHDLKTFLSQAEASALDEALAQPAFAEAKGAGL